LSPVNRQKLLRFLDRVTGLDEIRFAPHTDPISTQVYLKLLLKEYSNLPKNLLQIVKKKFSIKR
jgi:hypothetical protein